MFRILGRDVMKKNKKIKLKNKKILLLGLGVLVLLGIGFYFLYINVFGESKYLKISLNGDKNITLEYKEEYEDLGAKASYKDKDLTKSIKTTNNLDLDKIGSYSYTYTIKYKKQTKTISRNIEVVDT